MNATVEAGDNGLTIPILDEANARPATVIANDLTHVAQFFRDLLRPFRVGNHRNDNDSFMRYALLEPLQARRAY